MGPPNGKRKGASTVLPLAATAIRRKIHIGNNPVKRSGSVLCVLPGDDETRVVCFEHLVQNRVTFLPLGAFGDPLSPRLGMQTVEMYYSMHPPHGGSYGKETGRLRHWWGRRRRGAPVRGFKKSVHGREKGHETLQWVVPSFEREDYTDRLKASETVGLLQVG
jgi:hypothetical protein